MSRANAKRNISMVEYHRQMEGIYTTSVTPETLNQIWASIGAKYQPSVLYRARLVTIQDQEPFMPGEPITDIGLELHGK